MLRSQDCSRLIILNQFDALRSLTMRKFTNGALLDPEHYNTCMMITRVRAPLNPAEGDIRAWRRSSGLHAHHNVLINTTVYHNLISLNCNEN
jgi:hypothetical protein